MSDLINRQNAIDAFYTQSDDDGWWVGTAQDAEELLKGLPSAEPERNIIAEERYADLCEYFKRCCDRGKSILENRAEFKAWLDRMQWHVMECDKLARQFETQINMRGEEE